MPPEQPVLDVLEPSPERPRRRRTLVVALVVAAVLLTAAWSDRRARALEAEALSRCAALVQAEVRQDRSRISSMTAYVTPVMSSTTDQDLLRAMYAIISGAAETAGADGTGDIARTCAAADPLPWHRALGERRAACLRTLEEHTAYLRTVTWDGARVFRPSPRLDPACST